MKANHLVVVFPAEGLPENTVHACGAIWTQTSRMLLPGLGEFYDRFHPAARPWGVEISTPFSVVLGREDPCRFLWLYLRGRELREASVAYHVGGTLAETGVEKLQTAGDILICPVTLDGTNKRLEGHILWHAAMAGGAILPDCGVYYAERKRATAEAGLEKSIEDDPAGHALCVVTLELREDIDGI